MANKPETKPEVKPEQTPPPAQETPPAAPAVVTTDATLLAAVDQTIADFGGSLVWNQERHCRFIARLAIGAGLPKEGAKLLVGLLTAHGAGGNASQFRQWLETPADKKGPGKLPKSSAAAAAVADF